MNTANNGNTTIELEVDERVRTISIHGVAYQASRSGSPGKNATVLVAVDGEIVAYNYGEEIYFYNFGPHMAEIVNLMKPGGKIFPVVWDPINRSHVKLETA